jgi:hypothetical protein
MTNSKDMQRHITNKLHYFKNLQKQLDAHATKVASIRLRKEWLEKQKKMNYQNEYDRIRGLIDQNAVKGKSVASLEKRKTDLEKLGAIAVGSISH